MNHRLHFLSQTCCMIRLECKLLIQYTEGSLIFGHVSFNFRASRFCAAAEPQEGVAGPANGQEEGGEGGPGDENAE